LVMKFWRMVAAAVDAVEAAVRTLEDDPLFNAGRGSALNENDEIEMCCCIMNGKNLQSGAVTLVKHVKNPISLARAVMDKTDHVFLGPDGALALAAKLQMPLEPKAYFITDHAIESLKQAKQEKAEKAKQKNAEKKKASSHGTVGAVAVDSNGNVASATSTGGTENALEGRIGDSPLIGCGTYANNQTCAISCTGDGEYLMKYVSAFQISALMEYKGLSLQDACKYLIQHKCKDEEADLGFIGVDAAGNMAMEFNSERMHRGWKNKNGMYVDIYPD
jgi:beta-aspartyl-peptidase (threonine type)